MSPPPLEVTALLELAQDPANQQAREELYGLLEADLRRIACARLGEQPHVHSLNVTELVHEAWVRLVGREGLRWENRRHFFAAASRAIQNLLVDHYRKLAHRPRHLDSELLLNLPDPAGITPGQKVERAERVLALNDALQCLEQTDPNAAEVCRLRCFGKLLPLLIGPETTQGMKLQEIADVLDLPVSTVHSRWKRAVLYLSRQLLEFAPEGCPHEVPS